MLYISSYCEWFAYISYIILYTHLTIFGVYLKKYIVLKFEICHGKENYTVQIAETIACHLKDSSEWANYTLTFSIIVVYIF